MFHDQFSLSNEDANIFTDSAAMVGLGFGIYFESHWCAARWPVEWHTDGHTSDITILELFPVLVSIAIWDYMLQNKKIQFNCDNAAVVGVLNSWSSKSDKVMTLLRPLTIKCLEFNILIRASHVPGTKNTICNTLSRFQMAKFRNLASEADEEPQRVPEYLWNIFKTEQSL